MRFTVCDLAAVLNSDTFVKVLDVQGVILYEGQTNDIENDNVEDMDVIHVRNEVVGNDILTIIEV